MPYQYQVPAEEKIIAWDLRQGFIEIVLEIKKEIVLARNSRDYPRYYDLLDSLFVEVSKNLSDKEMEEYENLKKECDEICTKHSQTFLKRISEHSNKIYNTLRNMDIWLNRKMQEKDMYGSKEEPELF